MLDQLAKGSPTALRDLWGSLCHQGTVYSASFAAVPVLAEIGSGTSEVARRLEILVLIGSIVASTDRAPMPDDLRGAYEAALPRAFDLALKTLNEAIEPAAAVHLLAAAASLDGRVIIGSVLEGFADEELVVECPSCERQLYLWPDAHGLTVAAQDPVTQPKTPRTPGVPGPASAHEADYSWVLRVGGASALSLIAGRLSSLFGRATCPACGAAFSVMDELATAA
jgi:hypothetical protein